MKCLTAMNDAHTICKHYYVHDATRVQMTCMLSAHCLVSVARWQHMCSLDDQVFACSMENMLLHFRIFWGKKLDGYKLHNGIAH